VIPDVWADICICGQPTTVKLYVHYKYPRTEYLPEAMDPHYVHGGGYSIETCGSPQCEPDAFLARREQIADGLSSEQAAVLELQVMLSPEDGMSVIGDEGDAA